MFVSELARQINTSRERLEAMRRMAVALDYLGLTKEQIREFWGHEGGHLFSEGKRVPVTSMTVLHGPETETIVELAYGQLTNEQIEQVLHGVPVEEWSEADWHAFEGTRNR